MLFSMILLFVCLGFLVWHRAETGEYVTKGVSLKGGLTVTTPIDKLIDIRALETQLTQQLPNADIGVREITEGGRSKALIV
jgi:hypothetical protein